MATATAADQRACWITRSAAARVLGVSVAAVSRLVNEGRLTARVIPGCRLRLNKFEVELLLSTCTRRASVKAERPSQTLAG